jgi:LPS-assembly protein
MPLLSLSARERVGCSMLYHPACSVKVPDFMTSALFQAARPAAPRAAWYAMLLLLCTGPATAAELEEEFITPGEAQALDWVPIEDVPEARRDLRCQLCGGRYVDPLADAQRLDPAGAPIEARARSSELEGDTVRLSGGVEVVPRATGSFPATRRISTAGPAPAASAAISRCASRGCFCAASAATSTPAAAKRSWSNSRFVLHEQHLRGSAALLSRDADELVRIEDGRDDLLRAG